MEATEFYKLQVGDMVELYNHTTHTIEIISAVRKYDGALPFYETIVLQTLKGNRGINKPNLQLSMVNRGYTTLLTPTKRRT